MSIESALKKIIQLEKDLWRGQRELHEAEVRNLVDMYYQMQEFRKATANQIRSLEASDEPHPVTDAIHKHVAFIEEAIKARLNDFVITVAPGRWMMRQIGIGPVLAANFLAHLDIEKAATAGGFWRFAGLDPTVEWKKGERRPFNARLKVACWKASDSWVKLGERDDALYAKVYRERKAYEIARNEAGELADQAARKLEKFKIGKSTEAFKAYSAGKLPPAHLDNRARRVAVKLFLAHLHWVMWEDKYKTAPPRPYVLEHGGHVHCIAPPGWDEGVSLAA